MATVIAYAGIFVVIFIAEAILWRKWNPRYFSTGLPIFVRRAEKCRRLDDIPLEDVRRTSATAAAPPFDFRRISPDTIAFREGGLGIIHYAPVMRGAIRHDSSEPCAKVVGYMNWSVLALAIILVIAARAMVIVVAPYFLGAFAILYFIQAVRFYRVASHLA